MEWEKVFSEYDLRADFWKDYSELHFWSFQKKIYALETTQNLVSQRYRFFTGKMSGKYNKEERRQVISGLNSVQKKYLKEKQKQKQIENVNLQLNMLDNTVGRLIKKGGE